MRVKTFTGNGTKEVLDAIKAELGADAVILSSRESQENGRRTFEITAGVDAESVNTPQGESQSTPAAWNDWHKEWSRLKDHIYTLMQPAMQWEKLSPHQRVALDYLQGEGVDSDVIVEFYKVLVEGNESQQRNAKPAMLAIMASLLPVKPFNVTNYPQRLQIMAGPYGSGKTSAALRLAMLRKEERPNQQIGFINTDVTRGNGRLVLRHWADLSGFPYFEAPDEDAMRAALQACREMNCIFIDMQGLSRNEMLEDKIKFLGIQNLQAHMHLVLSPHYSNIKELLKRYRNHFPTSLLWTKVDEAEHYAELVNVAVRSELPVSAISFGAELQGTLLPAEESQVWRLILKHQLPDVKVAKLRT